MTARAQQYATPTRPRGGNTKEAVVGAVLDLIKTHYRKLRVMHIRPARLPNGRIVTPVVGNGGKGWFDLTIFGPGGLVFVECKPDGGYLRPDQRRRKEEMEDAGGVVRIWRTADLNSGRVNNELRELSRSRDKGESP